MKDKAITGTLKIGDKIIAYRGPFDDDISVVKSIQGKKAFTGSWYLNTDIYWGKTVYKYGKRFNARDYDPTFEVVISPPKTFIEKSSE